MKKSFPEKKKEKKGGRVTVGGDGHAVLSSARHPSGVDRTRFAEKKTSKKNQTLIVGFGK